MADISMKEVNFTNGEALETTDLNNISRFLDTFICDGILGPLCTGEQNSQPTPLGMYAVRNGGAVYRHAANNREVRFAEGVIMGTPSPQPTIDGNTPKLFVYYMKEGDVATKQRPAAAVNPRWDVLSVAFAEATGDNESRDFEDAVTGALSTQSVAKRRKVTATFTWTIGVEAATPAEPATPAGQYKLCAVRVTPGMTLFDMANHDLRDYRTPCGYRGFPQLATDVSGPVGINGGTAVFTAVTSAPGIYVIDTDNGGGTERTEQFYRCPISASASRVTGLLVKGKATATAAHTLNLQGHGGILISSVAVVPTVAGWGTFPITIPIWSNGFTAGYAAELQGLTPSTLYLEWEVGLNENAAQAHEVMWGIHGL